MERSSTYRFPYPAYPAVRIMLLLVFGIVAAYYWDPGIAPGFIAWAAVLVPWFFFEIYITKKWPVTGAYLSVILYMCLIASTGALLFILSDIKTEQTENVRLNLQLYEWEDIQVEGFIESTGISSGGREVYDIRVDKTIFPEGVQYDRVYRLRVYGDDNPAESISTGYRIKTVLTLYSFPEVRNLHEFDYGKWLIKNGFSGHGGLAEVDWVVRKENFSWGAFRQRVQDNIDKIFSEKTAPLAKALLLGYKQELHSDVKLHFARSGLSHIMAVSGLHVGFIVAPFWLLIPYLWGSNNGKWAGLLLITLVLLGYAGLTGFSPSVSRASLMAWFLTYGKLFHKLRNSVNLTAVAAIIILIINPKQLFDVGFQLSFSAVFIILLIMPQAQKLIPGRYRYGWTGGLLAIIVVSIVVQLGIFPILVYYFGEFSLIGPVANTFVLPLLTVVVPGGLLLSLLSPVSYELLQTAALPIGYMIRWIELVANSLGSQSGSFISFRSISPIVFLIWIFITGAVASLRIPSVRWKMVIGLLICLNLYLIKKTADKKLSLNMEVTFLDVGQGDAIHIETPNGRHILIDAGRWSPMGNSAERVLLPYFEHKGIEKLDGVFLSHPHADHIGGVPDLIEEMEIDAVYQSDLEYDSKLFHNIKQLMVKEDMMVRTPSAGDTIRIDESVRIYVIGPESAGSQPNNPNNHSLAFKIVYGDTSFLFTGDAEEMQERVIANRYGNFLKSNLYKVGHHGSNTSSTLPFIDFAKPDISVASLAFRNRFGHPGSDTVTRLSMLGTELDYTSLSGSVIYKSDGKKLTKVHWKE